MNPPLTYPKPSGYCCNGLSIAIPCPLYGVTNRPKVYNQSRAATTTVILSFARKRVDMHVFATPPPLPTFGTQNGTRAVPIRLQDYATTRPFAQK